MAAESTNHEISYTYDMAGIRDSKTVGDITYEYMTLSGKVMRQTWKVEDEEGEKEYVINFAYDNSGNPYAFAYEGTTYYYVLNQQGDVIRIVDANGVTKAQYQYNAWGKILSATGDMADINPLRYRGYYYDTETGLYYVSSRYYDPEIGRFINADAFASTGQGFLGCNMFVYCNNNSPRYTDSTGFSVKDSLFVNIKDGKIPISGGTGGRIAIKIVGTGLWDGFLAFIFGEDNVGESIITGMVSGISDVGTVPKIITTPLFAIYTFYSNICDDSSPVTGAKFRKALEKTLVAVLLSEVSLIDDGFNRQSLGIFQAGEDLSIGGINKLFCDFIDSIPIEEAYQSNCTVPVFGAIGGGARKSYYAFN